MKKLALAAALTAVATASFAGGLAEPVMEPEVVEATTSSSAGGIVVRCCCCARGCRGRRELSSKHFRKRRQPRLPSFSFPGSAPAASGRKPA